MPIYDLRCPNGHVAEVIQSFSAALPPCGECGAETTKVPSVFAIAGTASIPPPPDQMPQTWKGTYAGNREYVTQLRRTAEARQRLEERHPEIAGDRRPVIAHEGAYETTPLRKGDAADTQQAAPGHSHGHHHGHGHAPEQTPTVSE
jgi:putative FmdB family regulatory protein